MLSEEIQEVESKMEEKMDGGSFNNEEYARWDENLRKKKNEK
jgi:hypothetical protein